MSAAERLTADSLVGKALSSVSMRHMFEQIFCMSFIMSDRRTESRSWMSPRQRRAEEVEGDQDCFLMFLTGGGSCQRTCVSR